MNCISKNELPRYEAFSNYFASLNSTLHVCRGHVMWVLSNGAIIDMFWTFLLIRETVLGVFMPKNKFKNTPKALEPIFTTKIQKSWIFEGYFDSQKTQNFPILRPQP